MDMKDLEAIGDSFLANNDGYFVGKAFRNLAVSSKYGSLFESNNNRTWAEEEVLGTSLPLRCIHRLLFMNLVKKQQNLSFQFLLLR